MKFAISAAAWLLISQRSVTESTFLSSSKSGCFRRSAATGDHSVLFATGDDVPDIVKAYRKGGATVSSRSDATIPDTLQPKLFEAPEPPTNIPDAVVDAVPDSVTDAVVDVSPDVPVVDIDVDALPDVTSVVPDTVTDAVVSTSADAAASVSSMVDEFVQAVDERVQTADPTPIINPLQKVADAVTSWKAAIDEEKAVRATQWAAQHAEASATKETSEKAPTLLQYISNGGPKAAIAASTTTTSEAAATTKAKIGLMVSNTYGMFGKEAPPAVQRGMEGLVAPDINAVASSVSQTMTNTGPIGWVAAGAAILVATNQRQAGEAEARKQMEDLIQKEAAAVRELAAELKSMSSEIKSLNNDTADLRKKLRQTTSDLSKKELEISKQRLKVAEKELEMRHEVQKFKSQALSNAARSRKLEEQLKDTIQVKRALVVATEKVKEMEHELRAARGVPEPRPKPETERQPVAAMISDSEPELVTKVNGDTLTVLPPKKTTATAKNSAPKRKTVAAKKTASPKASQKPEPKVAKRTARKKAVEIVELQEDWTTLSDSALRRKTVVQLRDYLEARGFTTVDKNGKVLKKVLLLDAVRSI